MATRCLCRAVNLRPTITASACTAPPAAAAATAIAAATASTTVSISSAAVVIGACRGVCYSLRFVRFRAFKDVLSPANQ